MIEGKLGAGGDLATNRVDAYDFMRAFAIIFIFLGHWIVGNITYLPLEHAYRMLWPESPLVILGFLSGALLSSKSQEAGQFLAKRLTRIYIPLWVCLTFVVILQLVLNTDKLGRVLGFHYLGLSGFLTMFGVPEDALSIGIGLWFVTAIIVMYMFFPLIKLLLEHKNSFWHLLIMMACAIALWHWLPSGIWVVGMGFILGVYLVVTDRLKWLLGWMNIWSILLAIGLLAIFYVTVVIPDIAWIRALLLPLYPLAFTPIFVWVTGKLPRAVRRMIGLFAIVSYEFYLLHFYFIKANFDALFGRSFGLAYGLVISFVVVTVVASILYWVDTRIARLLMTYLLKSPATRAVRLPATETEAGRPAPSPVKID